MFDQALSEIAVNSRRRRLLQYLLETFLVCLIPIAWALFEGSVLRWSEVVGSPFGRQGIQAVNPVVIFVLGVGAGWVFRSGRGQHNQDASRIWCLPLTLLALAITWDMFTFGDWGLIWREYFYWSRPGADEGPILRDFLTYPVLSCLGYSAAATDWAGAVKPATTKNSFSS